MNENDAMADDEIRFGDNDRLAALVAHLVGAERLVLLTDRPGLLTADPRLDAEASLIEEVAETDRELEAMAGGPGAVGSAAGWRRKLAAAKIASWTGHRGGHRRRRPPGHPAREIAGAPGAGHPLSAPPRRA